MKQKSKKIATYTVSGVTFLGAVTGLLVNMTRLGDTMGDAPPPGIIQIMPTLLAEDPPVSDFIDPDFQHSVSYSAERSDTLITFRHASSAIDGPVKPVGMLGEGPFFILPKIGIDIKLVNNTDEAIFVTDAVIEVEKSALNVDPLLISIQNDGIVGYLSWLNDGWAEPETIKLSAKIIGTHDPLIELPMRTRPDTLMDAMIYNFDISPLLSGIGIDPDRYRNARDSFENDDEDNGDLESWREIKTKCFRKFGDLQDAAELIKMFTGETVAPSDITDKQIGDLPLSCAVELDGILTTSWNNDGAVQSRDMVFSIYVMVTPPEGLGAAGFQPTGDYDVKLRTDGAGYTISVPISQPVSPSGFDRFVLWVGADKSSRHELTVKLKYNQDGVISTPPIHIDYLRPKSTATAGSTP